MSYSIAQASDDLSGIVHGKTVNKITNKLSAATRAGRNLLAKIDPDETRQITQITLYDEVTDYSAPADLKEKRIIDVRPQVNRTGADNFSSRFSKDFDMKKWGDWFTVMDNGGTKYLRVKCDLSPSASGIDPLDSIGSWVASGDASSLAVDPLYSVNNGSSLKFNLVNGGAFGVLENTNINQLDLSEWKSVAPLFLWVYMPTATAFSQVKIRFGNSAVKYWESIGVLQIGTAKAGWNLFRFDWSTATSLGSPDSSAINYALIAFTFTGTPAVIRIDKFFASLPKIFDIEYYSKKLFRTVAGVWIEAPTEDTDLVNLDTASYNLWLYEFALAGLQQIQGKDARTDRDFFEEELYGNSAKNKIGLYAEYKMNNPSQKEKVTSTYYSNLGFRGRDGGRFRRY